MPTPPICSRRKMSSPLRRRMRRPRSLTPDKVRPATGQFTITRGGFPLNAITVNLGLGGPGTGFATAGLDYSNLPASVTLAGGNGFRHHHAHAAGEHEFADAGHRAIAAAAGRELHRRHAKQRGGGHLSLADGHGHGIARPVFHQFEHDLHEQQQFQSHEPVPDAH